MLGKNLRSSFPIYKLQSFSAQVQLERFSQLQASSCFNCNEGISSKHLAVSLASSASLRYPTGGDGECIEE